MRSPGQLLILVFVLPLGSLLPPVGHAQGADNSKTTTSEAPQKLLQTWENKLNSGFTRDELRRGTQHLWAIREGRPGTDLATQATELTFRLLDEGGPLFVDRGGEQVRLMEAKYRQVGLDEPVKARLLKYVPRFAQPPIKEWRRVAEQSGVPVVQQTALLEIAGRHARLNRYDRTGTLLDTLAAEHGLTPAHPRHGDQIKTLRREIEKFSVGGRLPPLRAPSLAGDTIDIADMDGTVRLLYFYGSTCGICVQMYPTLNRLHAKYDRDRFRLIGIPLDALNGWVSKPKYPEFMEKHGIEWPQVWMKDKNLFDAYNVGAYGTAMLLNREGTLVWLGRDGPIDATNSLEGASLTESVAQLVESAGSDS
jgi:peroxiredoxin